MFLHLDEIKKVSPDADVNDIDALEEMVRSYTSNKFNVPGTLTHGYTVDSTNTITLNQPSDFFTEGATIELIGADANAGTYDIEAVSGQTLTLRMPQDITLFTGVYTNYVALVRYPRQMSVNILKLVKYAEDMRDKTGIKSETISRMSISYIDVNAGQTIEGYPAMFLEFLNSYVVMKWGN